MKREHNLFHQFQLLIEYALSLSPGSTHNYSYKKSRRLVCVSFLQKVFNPLGVIFQDTLKFTSFNKPSSVQEIGDYRAIKILVNARRGRSRDIIYNIGGSPRNSLKLVISFINLQNHVECEMFDVQECYNLEMQ